MTSTLVTVAAMLTHVHAHRAAYQAFAERLGAPASMHWPAIAAWLAHHPGTTPLLVLVHRHGRLVAAAPLTTESNALGTRVAKAGVPGEPFAMLYEDEQAAAELAEAVVGAMEARDRRWWLRLTDLPGQDPAVEALARQLRHVHRTERTETPVLDLGPDAEAVDPLSRNTRQAEAKARNRIARDGHTLDLAWTARADDVSAVLPELVELHVARNEHLGRAATLRVPWQHGLLADTVLGHAGAGRVRLLTTRIDEELAGYALCFASGSTWWVYSNYAHPDWLHYSPGTLTNAEVVRAALAHPDIDALDWGAGIQRYKLSGGARLVTRQALMAESSTTVRAVVASGRVAHQVLGQTGRRRARTTLEQG